MEQKGIHVFLEKTRLPIIVVVLVPLGLIAFGLWSAYSGTSMQASTVSQSQQQTATPSVSADLSLNASSTLPTSVAAGDFVPFSFTIENTGSASASYQYKVYVKWSTGEEDVIDENVAQLSAGASKVVPENLKFETADETAQVYIELVQTGQTIQFALPRAQ